MNKVQAFYQLLDGVKGGQGTGNFAPELAQFVPIPGGRLMDIGCLDGCKTELIRDTIQAAEAYGVDFVPNRLLEAEERGIHTACVDLNNDLPLKFEDGYFDVVFCGEVIEHVFSPDDLVEEIARLLRPGGYAVITTPNLACWKNRIVLLFGWQPFFSEVSTRARYGNPLAPAGLPSGHIRMFTPRALRELAAVFNLKIERIAGTATPSGAHTLIGSLSRFLDKLIIPLVPTLADRMMMRFVKK
ncbi:MAG: class I SAM-dependent methyltransferase [Chloroflexota bacterium]